MYMLLLEHRQQIRESVAVLIGIVVKGNVCVKSGLNPDFAVCTRARYKKPWN
jgi:hypothetical protein